MLSTTLGPHSTLVSHVARFSPASGEAGRPAFSPEIREAGRLIQGPVARTELAGSPAILRSAPALTRDNISVLWAVLESAPLHLALFL